MRVFQVAAVLVLALAGMVALSRYGKSLEPTAECSCVGCCRGVPTVKTPTVFAPIQQPASNLSSRSEVSPAATGVSFDRARSRPSHVTDDTNFLYTSPPSPWDEVRLGPVRVLCKKPYIARLMDAFNWSPSRARS
jgi:hypothetical protein